MESYPNFNSDSTFYSIYELSKQSLEAKCKQTNKVNTNSSQFLDKVHNEVLLHLEGKRLLGQIQVKQYMRKISKMKLRNAKNQYFAEKIKSALLKIFHLTKQFQKSLSLSDTSLILDPLEHCAVTEDLRILERHNDNPKHILLRNTASCENTSFPLEILTNNNFTSLNSQESNSSENFPVINCVNHTSKNQTIEEIENNKLKVNSLELFPTENTDEVEHCSENCNEDSNLFSKPFPHKRGIVFNRDNVNSPTKYIPNSTNENHQSQDLENNEFKIGRRNDIGKNICVDNSTPSVKDAAQFICAGHGFKDSNAIESKDNMVKKRDTYYITDIISSSEVELSNSNSYLLPENSYKIEHDINENSVNKEINDVVSKILNNGENCAIKYATKTEISESKYTDKDQNFENLSVSLAKKVDLRTVTELGDFFNESYNKKINKLCYSIGNKSDYKTWSEIHNELEYEGNCSRNVNYTLNKVFEKLSLVEHENNEKEYKRKLDRKGNFHNFSKEDENKIDWESLFRKNAVKLENISDEFGKYLIKEMKTTDENDDFDGLDWRKLIE